ncbi:hypothetical protein D9M68_489530 [compost metagenome]
MVARAHGLDDILRYRHAPVRKPHAEELAELQRAPGKGAPFLPVVVVAMMGDDNLQPENACKRRHQCRADGVDMQYVRPPPGGKTYAEERVNQRLQRHAARRPERDDLDPVPGVAVAFLKIAPTPDDLDIPAVAQEFAGEHFNVFLDTALDVRNTAQAQHDHALALASGGNSSTLDGQSPLPPGQSRAAPGHLCASLAQPGLCHLLCNHRLLAVTSRDIRVTAHASPRKLSAPDFTAKYLSTK